MGMQEVMDLVMEKERANQMRSSSQLTLGELIQSLLNVPNRNLPIVLSNGMRVDCVSSWRGSYNEIAIEFGSSGHSEFNQVLSIFQNAIGKSFTGYKGGEFEMHTDTPVWVAQYGQCGDTGDGYLGVIDVVGRDDEIEIICGECEYL